MELIHLSGIPLKTKLLGSDNVSTTLLGISLSQTYLVISTYFGQAYSPQQHNPLKSPDIPQPVL